MKEKNKGNKNKDERYYVRPDTDNNYEDTTGADDYVNENVAQISNPGYAYQPDEHEDYVN